MSSSKRPSTSSLRRFITSRPYVPVAEIRRRFGLEEPDCVCIVERDGVAAYLGLPEREAVKVQDLWSRGEIGLELSVEVHAPVVVGIYPMRIARYVMEGNGNGHGVAVPGGNGHVTNGHAPNGHVTNGRLPGTEVNGQSDVNAHPRGATDPQLSGSLPFASPAQPEP